MKLQGSEWAQQVTLAELAVAMADGRAGEAEPASVPFCAFINGSCRACPRWLCYLITINYEWASVQCHLDTGLLYRPLPPVRHGNAALPFVCCDITSLPKLILR